MRHRVIRSFSAVAVLCLSFMPLRGSAAPADRSYAWIGELVAADATAKTVTVKLRIPEHVAKYVGKFKPGDRLMVVWDMIMRPPSPPPAKAEPPAAPTGAPSAQAGGPTEAAKPTPPAAVTLKNESDRVMYVDSYDNMKTVGGGYILPVELVSIDAKMLTAKVRVPDHALQAIKSAQPGKSIRVTTSLTQPTDVAAITAVSVVN